MDQVAQQRKMARAIEAGKKFKPARNIGGTAHFATLAECRKAGLLSGHGIPLGYLNGLQLWLNGDVNNMVTIGGSGSGKTSTLLISAALLWPNSFVPMDATGELTAVTAKARKKFGKVVQLNYTGFLEQELRGIERGVCNLMDGLDPKDKARFSTQAQHLAASCIRTPSERDLYWYSTALDLLHVFIMFFAEYGTPEERSFGAKEE
jgi:type IV secretory pathway TraG/TraD family ATPase VirD4